ncbi:hypothetical protein DVH24_015413 [Malus domestica]|uniref:Derlin n=1 Tax=Malus domestica TaxID=3750 RepID=A0A498KP12_MALDO|nr:hypothetical protein DVH24_015413 [Malus domestica]
MFAAALYFQLYNPWNIALDYGLVIKRFQVWRLVTNFFFLGPFSFPFACDLIMIARYGVALERGPFDKRTADFLWMLMFGALSLLAMAAVPYLWSPFMGTSVVFMIVYVWSREFPNSRVNIAGVVSFKGFYLPYVLLTLDLMFGVPLKPDIMGMVAGHLYYFLTVLHPLSGGKFTLKTPLWPSGSGNPSQFPSGAQIHKPELHPRKSFRLNGSTRTSTPVQPQTSTPVQPQTSSGLLPPHSRLMELLSVDRQAPSTILK